MLLVLAVCVSPPAAAAGSDGVCEELDVLFPQALQSIMSDSILRMVDQQEGNDTEECLNPDNISRPCPCRSLQYALHESQDTSVGGRATNLRLMLRPGVYKSVDQSNKIINSERIAITGAGISRTFFVCGVNGSEDRVCNYRNFQIINSSFIYISRATFTGCGPITSSIYVGLSDFVFIDKCSFE